MMGLNRFEMIPIDNPGGKRVAGYYIFDTKAVAAGFPRESRLGFEFSGGIDMDFSGSADS